MSRANVLSYNLYDQREKDVFLANIKFDPNEFAPKKFAPKNFAPN